MLHGTVSRANHQPSALCLVLLQAMLADRSQIGTLLEDITVGIVQQSDKTGDQSANYSSSTARITFFFIPHDFWEFALNMQDLSRCNGVDCSEKSGATKHIPNLHFI
ncbi:hypothetical protein J3458_003454 [Metarhizium acridum]|uniref:uncharacterized protein n=1 Tax=Metarhizium acridum TaxID=92637 RepID=UPI001C6B597E|nr:hypothetical protein J3458_003454 [Metarhizium acridum]